ncbi:MAG TPA: class I SAM-dependent methyltransferase, partial [Burkholderiaceae bacterium]|nr:class I SAM-dependent methyltransferase [Burkholderiaceae bacterium]
MQPVTERFSNRADAYVRGRPSYPTAIVEQLQQIGALRQGQTIVDIGVGTGLSAEPFLRSGYAVIGVEPNASMRGAGDQQLREFPFYRSIGGTAEATTLVDDSADLVIAGQAFHWFDVPRAAVEARRILRPGGWAALIWNDRQSTGSPFLAGYEALLRTHGIDYAKLLHRHIDEKAIAQFFAPATAAVATFDNPRQLAREDLLALAGSASYLPAPGDPRHAAMLVALNALFDAHEKGGHVQMMYRTRMHYAQLK